MTFARTADDQFYGGMLLASLVHYWAAPAKRDSLIVYPSLPHTSTFHSKFNLPVTSLGRVNQCVDDRTLPSHDSSKNITPPFSDPDVVLILSQQSRRTRR